MKISGTTLRPHSFARQKGAERKNGLFIGHRGFLVDQLPSVAMFTVYVHTHITTGQHYTYTVLVKRVSASRYKTSGLAKQESIQQCKKED
jgi:hypothetical protein